jgi:hypothetical protein
MEPTRIPNDREHDFFDQIGCRSLSEILYLVAARWIHNPNSGQTKTHRGWRCHAMLDRAGLRAFAIIAGTDWLSRPFAYLTEHVAPIDGDASQIPAIW